MLGRIVATSRTRARSLCDSLADLVQRKLRGHVIVSGFVALVTLATLGALGLTLHLSDTVDVARFLAGNDAARAVDAWQEQRVWPLAVAYLLIDAVVFVPLYAALTIAIAQHVARLD